MTPTREQQLPEPFGYVSDGSYDGLRFSRQPWPELHNLTHSTAAVYSAAQLLTAIEAARAQALEDAAGVANLDQNTRVRFADAALQARDTQVTIVKAIRALKGKQ
jgi:hypothetical protein